jgi:hypothetical protein
MTDLTSLIRSAVHGPPEYTALPAVAWSLEETDAVLDVKGLRQVRALVREARMLSLKSEPSEVTCGAGSK